MDSGVGGLAVLKQFVRQLPYSPYLFVGDTAWMPYGEKSLAVVRERVLEVHGWIHRTYPLTAFVLACNTATVAAFDALESLNLPYPLLEPVKTTAEWVNANIPKGKRIGILATPATVSGERYPQFLDPDREILQIPCRGLASIIETGVCTGPLLDEVLLPYLAPLKAWQADVIVLGCTHYSFIREAVQQHMGPDVTLIDSAEVLAQTAIPQIQALNMGNGPQKMVVTGNGYQFTKALGTLPLEEFKAKVVKEITIGEEIPLYY